MNLPLLPAALIVVLSGTSLADKSPPNIIYLMADDQNVLSVGAYGNPEAQTPNMDRLASDGVIFDRHYNTTAICMASRANVFTGMYEYKTGTNFSHGDMKAEVWQNSYPVLLRKAGYLTAFAGKFGIEVEGKRANGKAGLCADDFDMWAGGEGQTSYLTANNPALKKYSKQYPHSTLAYAAFAQDVIRESVKQKKKFCLSISFKAPHRPTTPDPRFDHIYAGKTFTKPPNFGRENGAHLSEQSKQGRQHPRFSEWKYDTDYDKVMATYFQQIYAVDFALGMIREELEAQGIADNTVIIYTSDNGFICGSHGYASKVLPMEESARAPLIIYYPGSPSAGKKLRIQALTGNIDLAPTILSLARSRIHPPNMDGRSLIPFFDSPQFGSITHVRDQLAFMNLFDELPTRSLTVLTNRYKYTYWWYGDDKMKPTEELFDLAADPHEMKNLANVEESAPELYAMRRRYDAEIQRWKKNAVPYNDYEKYGILFDRNIPVEEKEFAPYTPVTPKRKKAK